MTARHIPYGHQTIDESDIEAVVAVLRGEWLTQGPAVPAFEQAVAQRCGIAYAVAVNSATSALHIACLALDVGPGDLVWTTPTTFVASANCARYCGASVDFVDIDAETWCMSPAALADKLQHARAAGERLPKVVIPVHLAGQPCDMSPIAALAREYGFRIIEDASQALGASYQGQPIGACTHSDIAVFSFHPVKSITTAEGGMAVTGDAELAARMQRLRTHGIVRDPALMRRAPEGAWYYEQIELGFNYRLTDVQAALGISQLARLDVFVARRRDIAARYDEAFEAMPVTSQLPLPDAQSAHHLYVVRVSQAHHAEVFADLRAQGIGVNLHYTPVYLQPYYLDLGFQVGQFPNAEAYAREAISLPIFPSLSEQDFAHVVSVCRSVLTSASGEVMA
jgi:UDP-4-amino-4,6-dideoxy-N-acetyl-beta-L-altrosamine transaminase